MILLKLMVQYMFMIQQGPYTDPEYKIDVSSGLKKTRSPWIDCIEMIVFSMKEVIWTI